MDIECGGFTFVSNFDSSNIERVELVPASENDESSKDRDFPMYEFNIWTRPDCAGTEFENANRTWFYFGVKGGIPSTEVKLNVVNLNKQGKLYNHGMAPVSKIIPEPNHWERVANQLSFDLKRNLLTFGYKTLENLCSTTYFAFTYPYSFTDLQTTYRQIELKLKKFKGNDESTEKNLDDIYYHRECLIRSLEGRPVDLITISSYHGITKFRETRLRRLFPDSGTPRPFHFKGKKVVFLSARVHPGETPSSFVMNGVLQFLLNRNDPMSKALRRLYVFKLVPMLNPDGVSHGFYRTDTRGVNLNRFYLNPSEDLHPSVFAARSLILYHHIGEERAEESSSSETGDADELNKLVAGLRTDAGPVPRKPPHTESGLFLYADFHGHVSKKGIFMYGNHFESVSDKVECLLLPKLMSINNPHFHFNQCNFSRKNMYSRDRRGGLSKEGSGRVAVHKCTGLVRSYTLECNYNTGCIVNIIPPMQKPTKHIVQPVVMPPHYTPQIYEEIGKALCVSLLDLTENNPNSRLPLSQYKSISGLREALRTDIIKARSIHNSQNLRMRSIALLQRGELKYKTKLATLKKQTLNCFSDASSSSDHPGRLKSIKNKKLLAKKLSQKKRNAADGIRKIRKKMLKKRLEEKEHYKAEQVALKMEKKLSPVHSPGTSGIRPLKKKRRRSKIAL